MVLMVGYDRVYLERLAKALNLPLRKRVIVTTWRGLSRVLANPGRFNLGLIDLFWKSSKNDLISIDTALKQLREAGYEGRIEGCAYNPSANSYLSRMLKPSERPECQACTECPLCSVWDDVVDGDHPDLTIKQVAARLAPLLQS